MLGNVLERLQIIRFHIFEIIIDGIFLVPWHKVIMASCHMALCHGTIFLPKTEFHKIEKILKTLCRTHTIKKLIIFGVCFVKGCPSRSPKRIRRTTFCPTLYSKFVVNGQLVTDRPGWWKFCAAFIKTPQDFWVLIFRVLCFWFGKPNIYTDHEM